MMTPCDGPQFDPDAAYEELRVRAERQAACRHFRTVTTAKRGVWICRDCDLLQYDSPASGGTSK